MTVEDTLDAFNATRETASSFYENSTGAVAQIENIFLTIILYFNYTVIKQNNLKEGGNAL